MTGQPLYKQQLGHQVVAEARSWIGTPYQHQASLKMIGCDCLGLVRGVWRAIYGSEPCLVPAYSPDWAETGKNENLLQAASHYCDEVDSLEICPGDLLAFRWRVHLPAKHLAIVTTPASMVHAQHGEKVCEVPLSPWWRRHIAAAFRFRQPQSPEQGTCW